MKITIPEILRRMTEREKERQAAPLRESPYVPDSYHPPIPNPLPPISERTSRRLVAVIITLAVVGAGLVWLGVK